jgi:hypothetical protein
MLTFVVVAARCVRGLPGFGAQRAELTQGLLAEQLVALDYIAVLLFAVAISGLATSGARDRRSVHDVARFESIAVQIAAAGATADSRGSSATHAHRTASETTQEHSQHRRAHGSACHVVRVRAARSR